MISRSTKRFSATVQEMAAYEKTLLGIKLLGLTLTGFNEAADPAEISYAPGACRSPFGFATHKTFANEVAALLNTGQGSSAGSLILFQSIPLRRIESTGHPPDRYLRAHL